MVNRVARTILDLPEQVRMGDVEASLRRAGLWDNLFGATAGDQTVLTRPVTLRDEGLYQVELLRVPDSQRLLVGSLLRFHDASAMELAKENVRLNGLDPERAEFVSKDVKAFLRGHDGPPFDQWAFLTHRRVYHELVVVSIANKNKYFPSFKPFLH